MCGVFVIAVLLGVLLFTSFDFCSYFYFFYPLIDLVRDTEGKKEKLVGRIQRTSRSGKNMTNVHYVKKC